MYIRVKRTYIYVPIITYCLRLFVVICNFVIIFIMFVYKVLTSSEVVCVVNELYVLNYNKYCKNDYLKFLHLSHCNKHTDFLTHLLFHRIFSFSVVRIGNW